MSNDRAKTPRTFLIADHIWDAFSTMAVEMDSERDALGVEVRKLGLHFKSDTTAWQEYRRTKPDDFRLLRLEKLNSRFSAKVRRYFSRSPSQPSPAF